MIRSRRTLLAAASALAIAGAAGLGIGGAAFAADPLKVAFVYVGPVGDAGWTKAHDNGRKAVEAKFGDKVKTTFVENVAENGPDAERVIRDLASQGNKLIFGTTYGYQDAMLKVAKEFPDVKFLHATGFKTAPNLGQYDSRTYEGAYLAGVAAGKMTKSNKLGFIASFPIPEVLRNINAFTMGAQSVNPKVTTTPVWVNSWFDPGKEREAATTLINQGADVLLQNTDSPATLQTAEEKGARAFGWDSDMSAYGPKAVISNAIINWAPYYTKAVGDVMAGTWKPETDWWGVDKGAIDVVNFNVNVPKDVVALVTKRKAGIKDGSAPVWKGPILDQSGKEILKAGQVADDKFLKGVNFYVKGVEGKIPG